MAWILRTLAVVIAGLLLANNIAAAKGDVPIIVTMIAIAFLPLLFERSVRGGVLVVAFFVLWATVIPSAVERAGAQRALSLEERERHSAARATATATKGKLLEECEDGLGSRCRGLAFALEKVSDGATAAPPPTGVEILSSLLGIADISWPLKILTLMNALGSELAVAALIHMAVFWRGTHALYDDDDDVPPAPRTPPAPPESASAWMRRQFEGQTRLVASDVFNAYSDEWAKRGARAMSRQKFMNKLNDEAGRCGFSGRKDRGKIIYER